MTLSSEGTEKEVIAKDQSQEIGPDGSLEAKVKAEKTISFLTLGDGDFTYSLDLARYLASTNTRKKYSVTASGVDTREELLAKYKDAPFVLKQLTSAASSASSDSHSDGKLTVRIQHGVNAIVMPTILVEGREEGERDHSEKITGQHNSSTPITPKCPGSQSPFVDDTMDLSDIQPADHVMFHHPHLATEDAVLHQKFLCHLFHTVNRAWLAPLERLADTTSDVGMTVQSDTGFFHLTLVKGQAERWKCLEAARNQGFELVWRGPFVPPPPPRHPSHTNDGENLLTTTYQLRRHQTGKSFASRRPEWQSESLVFQRKDARSETGSIPGCILPWDIVKPKEEESTHIESSGTLENPKAKIIHHEGSLMSCPHCDKVFREERSLKCHLKAKHASLLPLEESGNGGKRNKKKKRKREITSSGSLPTISGGSTTSWHCPHQCKGMDGELRSFCSQEALESHIVAKHSGLHQSISPDWKQSLESQCEGTKVELREDKPENTERHELYGNCRICGWRFESEANALQHIHDFTPPSTVLSFSCRFCSKVFREKRAQLQHENFCSHRTKAETTTTD